MQPAAVIPALDPGEYGALELATGGPGAAAGELFLEAREEADEN